MPSNECFPSVYEDGTFDFVLSLFFAKFLKLNSN
jgi:hypothetical protein